VITVAINHLAGERHLLPTLQAWFEAEWPAYYGVAGSGDAKRDLLAYANCGSVPVGLVAFWRGEREAFPSHPHLLPWAGAAYVMPSMRRQGIGRSLLLALEREARTLGYSHIYCATGTSASLLERCGWQLLEHVQHDGQGVGVYEKAL
jgi:GNAT superfamily N-acetyltransferase